MNGDIRIASTANEYDKLRPYSRATDTRVVWRELNVQCDPKADLLVVVSHARSTIGSKMLQSKMTAIRITSVQFNLYLEHRGEVGPHLLKFDLNSLDDIEELERYPKDFQLAIEFELQTHCSNGSNIRNKSQNLDQFSATFEPISLFGNERELEECHELFSSNKDMPQLVSAKPSKPVRPPPPISTANVTKDEAVNQSQQQSIPKNNIFDTLQWDTSDASNESETQSQPIIIQKSEEKKPLVNDLLLNLSIDENTTDMQNTYNTDRKQEIPSDLFDVSGPAVDLFGGMADSAETSGKTSALDSNINLLNDINLCPTEPIAPPINAVPPMPPFDSSASNILTPNTSSKFSGPTLNNPSVPLQRNTSTPNLTKLDPLAQLGSFMSSATTTTTSAKTNTTSIPRVASYSTFQTPNLSSSQTGKPDYSRTYFDVKTNVTNSATSNKVFGNEFEDLLGGFKPTLSDNTSKSIAQMRKEEMVCNISKNLL